MRVAFDLTPLRSGATGVARYAGSLHDALVARGDVEAAGFTIGRGGAVDRPVVRHLPVPLRAVHRAWSTVGRPRAEDLVGPVDVVHATDLVPPPTAGAPVVLTVHDVLPLTRPDWFPPRAVRIARAQAEAARSVAAVVVTTCDATADAVAEVIGVPRARIAVATLGHRPVPASSGERPPYLLFVGAVTARKGLTVLADALARLPSDTPPLLVAGPDGHDAGGVRAALVPLLAAGRIRLLGRVGDDELAGLYAGALALCHPSEAEGFGIPVLEAMAAGTPVVAADIPPVREVAGDDAVLVPPGDAGAFADALGKLLVDDAGRAALAASGRRRVAGRTWAACAEATVAAYRRALDG